MLVICSECRAKISSEVGKCPKCGNPIGGDGSTVLISKASTADKIILFISITAIVLVILFVAYRHILQERMMDAAYERFFNSGDGSVPIGSMADDFEDWTGELTGRMD